MTTSPNEIEVELVEEVPNASPRRYWVADSNVVLRCTRPKTGEKRTVTVPMHDRIRIGTLKSIAERAGAEDFEAFCRWIDRNR
ncbi:type II toxin-antitoxin system HicA family toxin [Halomarina halobia]|uniref:Type II toxin-antitoxin system HicA family toxin n=1 Tax=Halomarina halobia TaxID=3033386 RepID=A0ABD6AA00_9EURY|nr:type II toxin-antitoxin system HicA family toxin [Halomarina sp. PSR21]